MQTTVPATPTQQPCPEPAKKKKNIIICCDGTGNQFGNANSNVVKLYTALTIDNDQVGYYHPGVGTMGDPAARSRLASLWSVVTGLAFGAGFRANVLDAYRYLMNTYDDGDRVYIFGFSRGAYTARALAGLLDGYGLLCKGNEEHIAYAWRMYLDQLKDRTRNSVEEGNTYAEAFKETYSHYQGAQSDKNFRIHFIGLWDTVSSIGWVTTPLRLFNVAQNRSVDHIRHAVSIDERRCFYQDNLYDNKPAFPGQDVKQVWFAGVHSDVGGSYSQETSGLANITLEWMIDEAKAHAIGVLFQPGRVDLVLGRSTETNVPCKSAGTTATCTHNEEYPACKALYFMPTCRRLHVSLTLPWWWILELLPHRYYDKDGGEEQHRIPLGSRRELPVGALVHYSVWQRMRDRHMQYRPKNLPRGTLTPVPNCLQGSPPRLYRYEPKHKVKDRTLLRWLILAVFVAVELVFAFWLLTLLVLATRYAFRHALFLSKPLLHSVWIVVRRLELFVKHLPLIPKALRY